VKDKDKDKFETHSLSDWWGGACRVSNRRRRASSQRLLGL